jgi:hypothetical protein
LNASGRISSASSALFTPKTRRVDSFDHWTLSRKKM